MRQANEHQSSRLETWQQCCICMKCYGYEHTCVTVCPDNVSHLYHAQHVPHVLLLPLLRNALFLN